MRFFNAIFALPFIAGVIASPVPAAEKRALAPSSSNPLDLVSILGDLGTKIVSRQLLVKATNKADNAATYYSALAGWWWFSGPIHCRWLGNSPQGLVCRGQRCHRWALA
jgi:hypothetical protein